MVKNQDREIKTISSQIRFHLFTLQQEISAGADIWPITVPLY
jgi:hypothetical protein